MTKSSLIKILGMVTTIAGMAASLLSDWVGEQKMNERIDKKVNEAIAEKNGKEKDEP